MLTIWQRDPEFSLAELPAAFVEARAQALASARYTKSACPADTCRYCGRARIGRWPLSRVDGHGKCFVGPSFQRRLYELWLSDEAATQQRIAEICDVNINTVKGWLLNVETRIGRAV